MWPENVLSFVVSIHEIPSVAHFVHEFVRGNTMWVCIIANEKKETNPGRRPRRWYKEAMHCPHYMFPTLSVVLRRFKGIDDIRICADLAA